MSYVDIPITFRPKDFGSAVWDMIRGKGTGYTIKGHINVDTPFGAMKLPISKEGGTTRFKKNKEDGGDDDDDEVCGFLVFVCLLVCLFLPFNVVQAFSSFNFISVMIQ